MKTWEIWASDDQNPDVLFCEEAGRFNQFRARYPAAVLVRRFEADNQRDGIREFEAWRDRMMTHYDPLRVFRQQLEDPSKDLSKDNRGVYVAHDEIRIDLPTKEAAEVLARHIEGVSVMATGKGISRD